MENFLSTLFLGLIATFIGSIIQQRTWRHRSLVELKERERNEARQAVESLSLALDQRLEAQRTYTVLVMSGSITDDDVSIYKKATANWMGGYSSNKSKIYHSFGRNIAEKFESDVQIKMQNASAVVALGRKHGVKNLSIRDQNLFLNSDKRLNFIQYEVYKFLNELNVKISNNEIGTTKAINNLSENDASMISRLYLIRRLLGIEGAIRRAY